MASITRGGGPSNWREAFLSHPGLPVTPENYGRLTAPAPEPGPAPGPGPEAERAAEPAAGRRPAAEPARAARARTLT